MAGLLCLKNIFHCNVFILIYIETNNRVCRLNYNKKHCIYDIFVDFINQGNYQFDGEIKNYGLVSVHYCRPPLPPIISCGWYGFYFICKERSETGLKNIFSATLTAITRLLFIVQEYYAAVYPAFRRKKNSTLKYRTRE